MGSKSDKYQSLFAGTLADNLRSCGRFSTLSPVTPFTTENLAGYLPALDLSGKRVLSVCGSGDHIINALALGCSAVLAIDINQLALHYAELKLRAVQALSLAEFRSFFFCQPENLHSDYVVLEHSKFIELRHLLSAPAVEFFDSAYAHLGSGAALRASGLFNDAHQNVQRCSTNNLYLLSERDYEAAQRAAVNSCSFVNARLQDWGSREIRESFDVILLSNIADYAHEFYSGRAYLERFVSAVIRPLAGRLAPGGTMCAAYIYAARPYCEWLGYRTDIDVPEQRRRAFALPGFAYEEVQFDSVIPGKIDAVILLRKPMS